MTRFILPALRPVRPRFGFAATREDSIERRFERKRPRSDRRAHRLEKSAQET
jgi:hypothetical protein